MKNIKTEKLNTAIGGISDKHIEAVGTLRNNAPVKQKRMRFWSVQYTGIAAAMLVLVVGTLLMFRFLAPDDIIMPPDDDVVAPPVEPVPEPAWSWIVEPTLEYDWLYYCGGHDVFNTGSGEGIDEKTGLPTAEYCGTHSGGKYMWLYDAELDLFASFHQLSGGAEWTEWIPMNEFEIYFPNEVDTIKAVCFVDSTNPLEGGGMVYHHEGAFFGTAVAVGNNFITDSVYTDAGNGRAAYNAITAVNGDNMHGIINRNGDIIVPFEFDELLLISETTAFANSNGKWGIIGFGDYIPDEAQILEKLSQIVDNLNVGVTGVGVLEWQVSENFRSGTNNPIKISWEQLSVYCEGKYVPDELSNGLGGTDYYQNEEYRTAQSPHLRYIAISDLYAIYNELFSKNAEDIVFAPGINEPSSSGLSHAYGDYIQVSHHGAGAFPIMIPTGHVFDGNTVTLTYATVAIGGAFNGFSNDIVTFYDGNIVGSVQYESYQDVLDGNFEYQLFPEVIADNYAALMKIDYTFILEDGKYKIHSITLNSAGNAGYPDGVRDELLVNVELSSILHESFLQNRTAITVPSDSNSSVKEVTFYGSRNINYFAFCEGYIEDGKIYLDELIFDVSYFSLSDYYIEYKPGVLADDRIRVVVVREQDADWFDLKYYILLFDSHDMAYFNETDEVVFVPFPLGMTGESNEEIPLANGATLTFETDEQYNWQTALFVVYDNGDREHLASMTSPQYEVSPDRTRIAFILSEYRTDHGELYIFDVMSRETIRIDKGDDIGKGILWLDDEVLLYVAGFAAGTVSQGGAVYQYNINDRTSHIIIDYREISKIELAGDYLNYTICVIFNTAMSYLRYTESISFYEVYQLIAHNGYIKPSIPQIN
jgi:hypothetical protein